MTSPATDGEVIAASRQQPERFEAIFDRHAATVHRYLRRRVGPQLAEELTAETFTRAFDARTRFDTARASALPWLYGIAINQIRMHARSDRRRRRALGLLVKPTPPPPFTTEADERLDAQALGQQLQDALRALAPDQREVLLLHAWAGLSPTEIAEALQISGAAARTRLHRARDRAARHLDRRPPTADDTESRIAS